jgi:hypothetical protein
MGFMGSGREHGFHAVSLTRMGKHFVTDLSNNVLGKSYIRSTCSGRGHV